LATAISMPAARGFGQTSDEAGQVPDQSELKTSSNFRNAVDAYIYGYPLLMFGTTERVATTVPYAEFQLGAAPLNQFGKEERCRTARSQRSSYQALPRCMHPHLSILPARSLRHQGRGLPGRCKLSPLSAHSEYK
jgi:hypothetical protein